MTQGNTIARAALFGAVSGLRSMMGAALISRHLARSIGHNEGDKLTMALSGMGTAKVLSVLSASEVVADKLPGVPARTQPGSLAARALLGALVGAAACSEKRENVAAGAIIGAGAAVAATFGAYYLRKWLTSEVGLPDPVVALAEDALALSIGQHAANM
jgi:uncharacterized membrane protein